MILVHVSSVLNEHGLRPVQLRLLANGADNYRALLFQPKGEIEADVSGVRNKDRDLARAQYTAMLRQAVARDVDIAVTPEYSMPWATLIKALSDGIHPSPGRLWAFGCESIGLSELRAIALANADKFQVIFEDDENDDHNNKFLDPLAYIFETQSSDSSQLPRMVVLVQFKTYPMGDEDHFERSNLQCGKIVYQFGEPGSLRLVSFICSDAFAITDAVAELIYDRSLVLHIQLNPEPRQFQYRHYRDKLLKFAGDSTELICLNWASNVRCWFNEQQSNWANISASAWYLRPDKFVKAGAIIPHRSG